MFIYNVTVNINNDVHEDWLSWMKTVHIPEVMATGLFKESRMCRVLNVEDEGHTYSIQYTCLSMEDYNQYQAEFAPRLQQVYRERYKDKFVAFRTLLQII